MNVQLELLSGEYIACLRPTRGLVGATLQARKASLYDSSLTPKALSPLKPSDSRPCGPPATRVLVSARTPEGRTSTQSQGVKTDI